MRIDRKLDVAYVHLQDCIVPGQVAESVECECEFGTGVILDFDRNGVLLGIEALRASLTLPHEILEQAEEYDR